MYALKELQGKINAEINSRMQVLSGNRPVELYIPVSYSMGVGGKRLRPVLLLMACNMFSDDISQAMPAALSIEMFHNFTLLHDDIMDKSDVRRNQPTVHIRFSENNAILSGDVMAFLSYRYLMESKSKRIYQVSELFTHTAIEVCEGQQLDMDFENRHQVTASQYLDMIRLKTAVLLGCALKSGALIGNSGEKEADLLYQAGINLGMAFQLQDDLLDTFGSQESFGKRIGNDILANKKTFLLITALEKGNPQQLKELNNWLTLKDFDPEKKIKAVTTIYNQLNIKESTQELIERYFLTLEEILELVNVENNRMVHLKALVNQMVKRNH